jgi:hypothetical protein
MCDVLLPPGVNPTAVLYIYIYISYHITSQLPTRILLDDLYRAISCEYKNAAWLCFYMLEPRLYKCLSAAGLCLNHVY